MVMLAARLHCVQLAFAKSGVMQSLQSVNIVSCVPCLVWQHYSYA